MRNSQKSHTRKRIAANLLFALAAFTCLVSALVAIPKRPTQPAVKAERGASGGRTTLGAPATLDDLLALETARLASCDVAQMNLLCAQGLRGAENLNVADCLATLDQWAERVRFETERHLYRFRRAPGEYDHSEAKFRMLMLGMSLQNDFRIGYNPERIRPAGDFEPNDAFFGDSRDVFLHGLLTDRRMGTCSSLPVLYVAVGRRLGYPLKLVETKAHVFVRWEDAEERFNIEASGRGVGWYDDAHFKQRPMPVTDEEIATCGFLKSLTAQQELVMFLAIRGHCLMAMSKAAEAVAVHEQALRLQPDSFVQQAMLAGARQELENRKRQSKPRAATTGAERMIADGELMEGRPEFPSFNRDRTLPGTDRRPGDGLGPGIKPNKQGGP